MRRRIRAEMRSTKGKINGEFSIDEFREREREGEVLLAGKWAD